MPPSNNGDGQGELPYNGKYARYFGPKKQKIVPPERSEGVDTARQYAKFGGKYPRFGRGFPRRYVDITPQEILYDDKILGDSCAPCDRSVQRMPTGETILRQPRLETERIIEYRKANVDPDQPCPPPFSQLPYIKRQIHLDPSRDAEIFFTEACGDVPASGSATILVFETWNNLRTMIRWMDFQVLDALCPPLITLEMRIEGQSQKYVAQPTGSVIGTLGITHGTVTAPNALDIQCLPKDFHNSLVEITDRRLVEMVVTNTAVVDRFVRVCLWGWIESVTRFDNCVRR